VLVAQSKLQPGRTALKLHRDFMAYDREKRVYQRLRQRSLHRILGFHIPSLIRLAFGVDSDRVGLMLSGGLLRSGRVHRKGR
jgi:hypothetical protein